MVTVQQEQITDFERRYIYTGSGASAAWVQQHRKIVTTTTRIKGTASEIDTYLTEHLPANYSPTGTEKKSWTKRKSNGPWWEADFTETTGENWETDSIDNVNS